MRRQIWRKALIFISFLLFPLTIYYFSPALIIIAAADGIVATSFIIFTVMFFLSLVFGRLFCGWVCPAGGLQEASFMINNKAARGGKAYRIKYYIWVPWLLLIILLFIRAGGIRQVDPLYHIPGGISVSQPGDYIIYFFIVGLIFILSLTAGKRAFCHYLCWMAPFMIIGTKIKSVRLWPSLHLTTVSDTCNNCKRCNKECPMSLDVNTLVNSGIENNPECILCAACIDACPQSVLRFSFSKASLQHNKYFRAVKRHEK